MDLLAAYQCEDQVSAEKRQRRLNVGVTNMKKYDVILDLCMRLLLFGYNAVMLGATLFQIKRDKQFLIIIGVFTLICTSVYLFEGVYFFIKRKRIPKLANFLYGDSIEAEELPPMREVIVILLLLVVIALSIYLFGVFVTVFVTMVLFPILYDKRNIFISFLLAAVTCVGFYYVFVQMVGIKLTSGFFFGF
jgi:hypothetical protein